MLRKLLTVLLLAGSVTPAAAYDWLACHAESIGIPPSVPCNSFTSNCPGTPINDAFWGWKCCAAAPGLPGACDSIVDQNGNPQPKPTFAYRREGAHGLEQTHYTPVDCGQYLSGHQELCQTAWNCVVIPQQGGPTQCVPDPQRVHLKWTVFYGLDWDCGCDDPPDDGGGMPPEPEPDPGPEGYGDSILEGGQGQ